MARTTLIFLLATGLAAAGAVGQKKLLWLASLILAAVGALSFLGAVLLGI
jgi:hypothetical protein